MVASAVFQQPGYDDGLEEFINTLRAIAAEQYLPT